MNTGQFVKEYAQHLYEGNGVYFIGAGISVDSGLPDWKSLLSPFTSRLGIEELKEKDLPLIAQFIINEEGHNRGPFLNAISKQLRKRYSPNPYHESIVRTNVKTIWTTNYDTIIEDSFSNAILDIKTTDEDISRFVPDNQLEIIKMHGCIRRSRRDDIVISEADYEDYFLNRPATAQRLRMDLLTKSFLFIGYGLGDPNIKSTLIEARRLAKSATRQHYLITKEKSSKEFDLWCKNLKRSGISVVTIKEHSDLREILDKLSIESRGQTIFITGSHNDSNTTATELGALIGENKDMVMLDGQSTGIMRQAGMAFLERAIRISDITKRLRIFANPYAANPAFANNAELLPILKSWREPLIKNAHVVVVFDGKMGTRLEVELAKELGCVIIPVPGDKDGYAFSLISDKKIKDTLEQKSPEYYKKLSLGSVTAVDVFKCIQDVFKN